MTDLPQFQKGKMGPLSFSDINKMTERLDRVQQSLESIETSEKFNDPRRDENMCVFATESTTTPRKFDWREVILHNDSFLVEADDAWETIEPTQQYRFGFVNDPKTGLLTDDYAISADPTFTMGHCMARAIRQTDGTIRVVLFPIISFDPPEASGSLLGQTSGTPTRVSWQPTSGQAAVDVLVGQFFPISFVTSQDTDEGLTIQISSPSRPYYDFSHNKWPYSHNYPIMPDTVSDVTKAPLDNGTICVFEQTSNADLGTIYYRSVLPRLNIWCDKGYTSVTPPRGENT